MTVKELMGKLSVLPEDAEVVFVNSNEVTVEGRPLYKPAHAYRVALAVGGLMESPRITYEDEQVIYADNEEEARKIYNERNHCSYYYGTIRGQLY